MAPSLIFGDITAVGIENVRSMLLKYGTKRLDSAASYGEGAAEGHLGDANMGKDFVIDTKILGRPVHAESLSPDQMDAGSKRSLEKLRIDRANVLYCHVPDLKTPLEEQARGFNDVYGKGRFKELGVSNMMPDMFDSWLKISKENNYVKPTWFEGHYNLLCRTFEDILFPRLREEGAHFAAYSPLGGGFLRGNFTPDSTSGERFVKDGFPKLLYTFFYDRPEFHAAFEKLRSVAEETGMGTDELSLRWIMHHSKLQDDDAIILGAGKLEHFEDAMQKLQKGPLDSCVVDALDKLWTSEMKAGGLEIVDRTKWPM